MRSLVAVLLASTCLAAGAACLRPAESATPSTTVASSSSSAAPTPSASAAPSAAPAPAPSADPAALPPGLKVEDIVVGTGPTAVSGDRVTVHYTGTLDDGTIFDTSRKRDPFVFSVGRGQVIKGWDLGVAGMKVGGRRKLTIPADLAYGERGQPPAIPGGATLHFDVELMAVDHPSTTNPAMISARHVLIAYMGARDADTSIVRTREQARAVAEEVWKHAKAGDDFERLVVEFSDEPNAASRGGSLGRFGKGKFVREFDAAAFALKPGEVSGVVETPFGFHVIQRTE